MSSPPPLNPEPETPPTKRHGVDLNQIAELIAESGAGDYLVAIGTGIQTALKTFRDARRKRHEPQERK